MEMVAILIVAQRVRDPLSGMETFFRQDVSFFVANKS
jgi:hypothetical protein